MKEAIRNCKLFILNILFIMMLPNTKTNIIRLLQQQAITMKSRILSDVDHKHEVYFSFKDFDRLYRNFDDGDYKKQKDPYGLMLCAKACFIKKKYTQCLNTLLEIRPDHSTKIIYERQALIMKTYYLLDQSDFKKIEEEYYVYINFKNKCPGKALTPFHDSTIKDLLNVARLHQKSAQVMAKQSKEELRKRMRELQRKKKFQGLPSYLISVAWNDKYKEYIIDDGPHPSAITNLEILNHIFEFQPHPQSNKTYTDTVLFPLTEDINYVVVSSQHWKELQRIFRGNPVKRVFINDPKHRQLSGNDMLIKLLIQSENIQYFMQWQAGTFWERSVLPLLMSILGPGQLKEKTRNDEYLIVQPGKIFQPDNKLRYVKVDEDLIKAVGEQELLRKKKIFMHFDLESYSPADSQTRGIVGLANLGNTCYMNSALQCLSNIVDFSHFFLKNKYVKDLNISETNKDGSQGEVTCALADIFKRLWFSSHNTRYIDPIPFKRVFGIRFKDFDGFDQQDAQQFLMFLLNCLHDDLNQNSQMKIAHRDSMTAKSFQQVRNYTISFYNRHNKSLITSLLHGFHYEEIVCDKCQTTSYRFEDYLMKHLQVPPDSPKMNIYYVEYNQPNSEAHRVPIFLNDLETVSDMSKVLKDHFQVEDESKLIALLFYVDDDASDCWKDIEDTMKVKKLSELANTQKQVYVFFHKIPKLKEDEELFLFYYVYQHKITNSVQTDGFPRLMPVNVNLRQKKFYDQLLNFTAETIIKLDPDRKQLIDQAKCKKIKGSPYTTAVKVKTSKPIKNFKNELYRKVLGNNVQGKQTTLYDCLDKMNSPETIHQNQSWFCDKCKAIQTAHKTDRIYSIGQIFIVQLKRFTERGKITTKIEYPINNLDMKDYVDQKKRGDMLYDLKGVVLHRGSLNSGHYTCYCRNAYDNKWYHYDDQYVREVEQEYVVDANAYILLYERSEIIAK